MDTIDSIGVQPFKDEKYLFYIRTQCVPRSNTVPLRYNKTWNVILCGVRELIFAVEDQ
jgi:hypothetical protein